MTQHNTYDAGKFHVINRTWFGLTKKHGGDVAAAYTFGSATGVTHLTRWYPKGPIKVLKTGARVLATLGTPASNADVEYKPIRVYKSSAAGASLNTLIASYKIIAADTSRLALYGVASKETMASAEVEAGRYISIRSGSPTTADGTADNGTVNGSVAFFIDWRPHYDPSSEKWDT